MANKITFGSKPDNEYEIVEEGWSGSSGGDSESIYLSIDEHGGIAESYNDILDYVLAHKQVYIVQYRTDFYANGEYYIFRLAHMYIDGEFGANVYWASEGENDLYMWAESADSPLVAD